MPPTLADRVAHILPAIERIERLMRATTFDAFEDDEDLRATLERYLERISEASRHLPDDAKASHPEIAWQKMADLGNRLRHACHDVDPKIIWTIIEADLAPLKTFVRHVLEDGSE